MKFNRNIWSFIFAIIFLIEILSVLPLVSADELNFQIFEKNVIVEYNFDLISFPLELRVPFNVKGVESNVAFDLIEKEGEKFVKISSGKNVSVKYIADSMIEKSGKEYYFVYENVLNKPINAKVYLEEGYILSENGLIFPKVNSIDTDGRKIILHFNNFNDEQIVINYEEVVSDNWVFYLIISGLIIILVGYYFFARKKIEKEVKHLKEEIKVEKVKLKEDKKTSQESSKERKTSQESSKERKTSQESSKEIASEEYTKHLFEDEKKIIEYLLEKEKNECWTKELVKGLNISKVKLSRKLRSLEQKELIKRIPYGNENRIVLVKK